MVFDGFDGFDVIFGFSLFSCEGGCVIIVHGLRLAAVFGAQRWSFHYGSSYPLALTFSPSNTIN